MMESNDLNPLVLHVEDDDGDAHLVVRCVANWPVNVRIQRAINGGEALNLIREIELGEHETPHLVLLDLGLPYYSGAEILLAMRAIGAFQDVPIIVLTSSEIPEDMEECREAGCTEYVVKPMVYLDLKQELDRVCKQHLLRVDPEPEPESNLAFVA